MTELVRISALCCLRRVYSGTGTPPTRSMQHIFSTPFDCQKTDIYSPWIEADAFIDITTIRVAIHVPASARTAVFWPKDIHALGKYSLSLDFAALGYYVCSVSGGCSCLEQRACTLCAIILGSRGKKSSGLLTLVMGWDIWLLVERQSPTYLPDAPRHPSAGLCRS